MYQGKRRLLTGTKYLAVVLGAAFVLNGCASGIRHSKVVDPVYQVQTSQDISKIGSVTSLKEVNSILYAGAQEGLAALDSSGKVLWTLSLPYAEWRFIDADEKNIAFTSYTITGKNEEKGFFFIPVGKSVTAKDPTVGLATTSGSLVWSVESKSSEQSPLSPPALSKNRVGVTRYSAFALYDREDGKEFKQEKIGGLFDSLRKTTALTRPVTVNNMFYVGRDNKFIMIDDNCSIVKDKTSFGLFSPIMGVTAGPVVFKDKILFAREGIPNGSMGAQLPHLVAVDKNGGKLWDEKIKAITGENIYWVNALASNSKNVYVSTKLTLSAFNEKGSEKWLLWNKDGGLYSGAYRFVGSPGTQIVATDKYVYITSNWSKTADALTVLDAESGEYIESLKVNAQVLDMTKLGANIVLATNDGLKFIAMK